VYFPFQVVLHLFLLVTLSYITVHWLRDEDHGLHTGNPLTDRLRVHAGRRGGDSLVAVDGKRWTRLESKGNYIHLFNFLKINY
jgi:hypothetical protein